MLGILKSCIGTKFTSQFGDLIAVSILYTVGKIFIFQFVYFVILSLFLTCENLVHGKDGYTQH